jgi:hypothetical protein
MADHATRRLVVPGADQDEDGPLEQWSQSDDP